MARAPGDGPGDSVDRAWHGLAVVADTVFLVAVLFVVYTAAGGEIRWRTALFRITLTEPDRPVQLCLLALAVKALSGQNRGLFAALATARLPLVAGAAALLHVLDRRLRALYLGYRLPLLLSGVSVLVTLGLLELYLRSFPDTLPQALANHVASGYHTGPSGIYRDSPELRMRLMRPSHARTMYFNGYRWHHRTDSRGFRNPVERDTAAVVLLGDSIVYGHGVEETSTVRHHLEALLGRPVANLGIQGSSIHQEYQVLKTFGLGLRPRHVYLFFLANDIDDLGQLTDRELAAFLDTAVTDHVTPYLDVRPRRPPRPTTRAYRAAKDQLADLAVAKAFGFLRGSVRARWDAPADASEVDWGALPAGADLPMRFHLHALRKIQDLADRHRFRFVNVFLHTGHLPHEADFERILEAFGRAHGIAFLSLRPAFQQAVRRGERVLLEGDGHLADGGARLAARVLAQHIDRHPAPPPGP